MSHYGPATHPGRGSNGPRRPMGRGRQIPPPPAGRGPPPPPPPRRFGGRGRGMISMRHPGELTVR